MGLSFYFQLPKVGTSAVLGFSPDLSSCPSQHDLIQSCGFKNHMYPIHSKISILSLDIATELRTYRANCLLTISAWVSKRFLNLNLFKTESLTFLPNPASPRIFSLSTIPSPSTQLSKPKPRSCPQPLSSHFTSSPSTSSNNFTSELYLERDHPSHHLPDQALSLL